MMQCRLLVSKKLSFNWGSKEQQSWQIYYQSVKKPITHNISDIKLYVGTWNNKHVLWSRPTWFMSARKLERWNRSVTDNVDWYAVQVMSCDVWRLVLYLRVSQTTGGKQWENILLIQIPVSATRVTAWKNWVLYSVGEERTQKILPKGI